jgi:hypothetical protein
MTTMTDEEQEVFLILRGWRLATYGDGRVAVWLPSTDGLSCLQHLSVNGWLYFFTYADACEYEVGTFKEKTRWAN